MGFPNGAVVKNPPFDAGDARDAGSILGLGRSPGEGKIPTPVFLLEKFHEQRRLVGYSLWGVRNSVGNSERDGNTRPPDLPLEKSVCRSGSNS